MDTIMGDRRFIVLPARGRGHGSFSVRIGTALANTVRWASLTLTIVFDAIGEQRQRAYERRLLAEMDAHACRDIGVNPRGSALGEPDPSLHDYWRR